MFKQFFNKIFSNTILIKSVLMIVLTIAFCSFKPENSVQVEDRFTPLPANSIQLNGYLEDYIQNSIIHWNKGMETCVGVTWLKLCSQILRLTGDPLTVDMIEKYAYNGLIGAMKPAGDGFSYVNLLNGVKTNPEGWGGMVNVVDVIPEKPTLASTRIQFRVPTNNGFIRMVDYASVNNWNGKHICTWLPKAE